MSSLAAVLTALYWAGGSSENGSFREVVVNRGSERIATIDLLRDLILKAGGLGAGAYRGLAKNGAQAYTRRPGDRLRSPPARAADRQRR